MTMQEVIKMFEQGYKVVIGSCEGESVVDEIDEIIDTFEEVEEDHWLYLEIEVKEDEKVVELFVQNEE